LRSPLCFLPLRHFFISVYLSFAGDDLQYANREISRYERKARRAMEKTGLQRVEGIKQVFMRRGKGAVFMVDSPDVYKSPSSDTYVFFGQYHAPDMMQAAEAFKQAAAMAGQAGAEGAENDGDEENKTVSSSAVKDAVEEVGDDDEVDESGVEAKDIELVMTQAGVSRPKAVKALKAADNDIVTAIMELTM
jgi:nascent polypeptide-associated complex subunit alpha